MTKISEYDYDYEERLLKSVDNAGSLKSHYTELYVEGIVGDLTLARVLKSTHIIHPLRFFYMFKIYAKLFLHKV